MIREKTSRRVFVVLNVLFLSFYALVAVLPLIHLGAVSLSKPSLADAGKVAFWPMEATFSAYSYVFSKPEFFQAFLNSILRLLVGVPVNMLMICLVAYPLSRPGKFLRARSVYSWFFMITMLFAGGTVPTFMLVSALGLKDNFLSMILPGAVPVFSVVLMMNFFRQVPEDLNEAASIDGAGQYRILFGIYLPLSLPSVVTLTLFSVVAHWNSWLDGVLYMSSLEKMPLQAYLQSVVVGTMEGNIGGDIISSNYFSQKTVDAARLFLAVIPVALIYFPLQKYFIKGLTLGGVKG